MSLLQLTVPETEPVTLEEAKLHLRVTDAAEDALISGLIMAARTMCEHILDRSLISQQWQLTIERFHYPVVLQKPPVIQIDSLKYYDQSGVLQTLDPASYRMLESESNALLYPAFGQYWPISLCRPDAVIVTYTAGWANAALVPAQLKQWMLLQIGFWYENRESVNIGNITSRLPFVDGLLDRYRRWKL